MRESCTSFKEIIEGKGVIIVHEKRQWVPKLRNPGRGGKKGGQERSVFKKVSEGEKKKPNVFNL